MTDDFLIRLIEKRDNPRVAEIIKIVMTEFEANGEGFAFTDPSVQSMFEFYNQTQTCYFVVEKHNKVYGGAGIAPLEGGPRGVCELQKMYFLPEVRGHGLGSLLLEKCLVFASESGFTACYLETLEHMHEAKRLYQKFGFTKLSEPLGDTGHFGCNNWFLKKLHSKK